MRLLMRLLLLVAAFAAVPIAMHEPLRRADAERRAMLLRNAQDQARIILAALTPLFDRSDPRAVERINEAASSFAGEGTTLRIVHARGDGDAVLLVAAHPPVTDRDFAVIRERLRQAEGAGLDRARCAGSGPIDSRIAGSGGSGEILGAAAMSGSARDCWTVLVGWSSAPFLASSLGRSFWTTPEMRLAALAHLALFAVAAWLLVRSWLDTRALGRMSALIARRSPFDPRPATPAKPSVLTPAQETTVVATLREAKAGAVAAASAPPKSGRLDAPAPPASETRIAAPPAATPIRGTDAGDAPASVELRKQIADRVFDIHDACTRNGLSLSYEALHPVDVRARAAEVDAIVVPLLDRALAASRHGDVLRVALRIGDDEARVHIEDAGRNTNGVATPRAPGAGPEPMTEEADQVLKSARRTLEDIGGGLDVFRLESGALRVTARFPRTTAVAAVGIDRGAATA